MILRILLLVVVLYGAVTAMAYVYAERVIFQPPPPSYDRGGLPYVLAPVSGDDSIALLHLPNDSARYTILLSHGNAEDLGHAAWGLERLRDAGFAVVAYDYRGYGRSTRRRPNERRAIEDAEAAYRYVVEELGVPPERLILHGRSVGSGPTLALAERHEAAGVVLESAFTSTYRVLTRVPLLPFDRFPNLARVRRLERPLLVIHGTADRMIPPSHGRALYAAAPGPKRALWVDGAGHNDLVPAAGPRYAGALAEFEGTLMAP